MFRFLVIMNSLTCSFFVAEFLFQQISEDMTVEECRNVLIEHYLQGATIQLKPWDTSNYAHISDLYTNLSVYKKVSGHRGGREETKVPVEGSVNGIFSIKFDGRRPLRILLLGGAGYGKTTVITKIVHDWATQAEECPIKDVPLLFALKLRETDIQTSLGSAIKCQLLGTDFHVAPKQLEKFISENDKECCVLLDGYDEFPGSVASKGRQSSLVELMCCKQFKGCLVLITSRPHRMDDFDTGILPRVFARMEIGGYLSEDAEQYIMRFFQNAPLRGQELVTRAKEQHAFLDSLLCIPFFCMVLCCLFDGNLLKDAATLTQIFNSLLTYLAQHAKYKADPSRRKVSFSSGNLKSMLNIIGRIAFESLLKDSKKLIFTEDDFAQCPGELGTAVMIGLLSKQDVVSDPIGLFENPNQTLVEFYHKLAQEHCAGIHLSSIEANRLKQVLGRVCNREKVLDMENVLLFATGSSTNPLPFLEQVVSVKWPDETFMKKESDSSRVLLNMLAESASVDEQLLVSSLRPYFAKGSLVLSRLTVSMTQGLEKLPAMIKEMVSHSSVAWRWVYFAR